MLRQPTGLQKTDDSPHQKLQRHYGMDPFKCHYYACSFRRHGFDTYKECDVHMKKHRRPWKCPVKAYDFSVIGYPSPDSLERHRLRVHRVVRDEAYTQPRALDDEALYPLLYELVNSGDFDELNCIWPACQQKINLFTKVELLTVAAGQGSLPMVRLFLKGNNELKEDERKRGTLRPVIHNAIQSGNLELTRWILHTDASWRGDRRERYRDVVVSVLKSDSAEVFDIWQNIVLHMPKSYGFCEEIFEKTVLNTAKKFPQQEARMLEFWRRLVEVNVVGWRTIGRALGMVARTTYSIEQARVLLELGAPIDHPRPFSRGYTALQWACNASSKDAAHFVKFLLFEGADPEHVKLERGQRIRNIETWLGMTWSELVKWAAKEGKRRHFEKEASSEASIS
ncbi:hypothetical protein IMZ48_27010 [Candidatus Bathyarchaeota archaeon]|nr:hypothetical protein [Candidatus Bathyarchaeota archaeon]